MKKKNKIIFLVLILLTLPVLLMAYFLFFNSRERNKIESVNEQVNNQTRLEDEQRDKDGRNIGKPENNQPQQSSATASPVSVAITSYGQADQSVYINSIASGTTSGNCELKLSNESKTITKNAPIVFQVSYYVCQGFSLSTEELGVKGAWDAQVNLSSPRGSASSEKVRINIK